MYEFINVLINRSKYFYTFGNSKDKERPIKRPFKSAKKQGQPCLNI